VFDWIANAVSGSAWTYLLIVVVCAGDALLPVLPSETIVVAAAVLAANDHLSIALVLLAAATGALLGDNAAYGIGHSGLRRLAGRFMRSDKSRRHLEWGREQLERHGVWIIVVARFIPGGRTATTYVAGTVGMPWKRRFLPATTVAATLWALYSSGLGYLGGSAFENNLWLPMLIGAGVSLLVGGAGEVARRKVLAGGTDAREPRQSESDDPRSARERQAGPYPARRSAATAAPDPKTRGDSALRSRG
jgi:membrane protein DedA with SNARE-associated domain